MVDVVDKATRSRMMSGIRGKNTKPELLIRSGLHKRGFRFRLHVRSLPGTPDLVLRKHGAVIFVHGCFWHGHDCHLYRSPSSNARFWKQKIGRNRVNDTAQLESLRAMNWRVLNVWECAIKGRTRRDPETLLKAIERWLISRSRYGDITGKPIH